ncbi:hypothetical protein B0T09DRAFT_95045 [Sordaria sp. MPI-SDFR-AT-0083]|nr:hypothetical protein B0T09DRAFT_95045 [Sordaria sp. MPI-SDFR-AT-0083]
MSCKFLQANQLAILFLSRLFSEPYGTIRRVSSYSKSIGRDGTIGLVSPLSPQNYGRQLGQSAFQGSQGQMGLLTTPVHRAGRAVYINPPQTLQPGAQCGTSTIPYRAGPELLRHSHASSNSESENRSKCLPAAYFPYYAFLNTLASI